MTRGLKINMAKLQKTIQDIENEGQMSIREICRKMGAHESYLSKIKKGEIKKVSADRLLKFCEVVGLNPNDFIEGMGRITDLADKMLTPKEQELIDIFRQTEKDGQDVLLEIAKILTQKKYTTEK